ncbi:MAG: regulatory iron-sulfur-containing complex subunit RicT [Candidatus Margulisiibacteriota bacterium]|jgi:cell fate regulator YaaT (PSP1 superfamily)
MDKDNCAYFGININNKEINIPYFRHLIDFAIDDLLILDTNRGQEFGKIIYYYNCCRDSKKHREVIIKKIVRKANEEDLEIIKAIPKLEQEFKAKIHNILKSFNLHNEAKVCKLDLLFDKKSLYVFLKRLNDKNEKKKLPIAELINDLKKEFHLNIFLEEISERNFAQKIGGLGICGYPLCCKRFQNKLSSVSVKFAREQNLAINLQKLSGQCNKLKCCIKYEKSNYKDGKLDSDFFNKTEQD